VTDRGLNVALPQFIQRRRSRQAVHFAAAAESSFVDDPTQGFETSTKRHLCHAIASGKTFELRARWCERQDVSHLLKELVGNRNE
jgi:hypothetical protein